MEHEEFGPPKEGPSGTELKVHKEESHDISGDIFNLRKMVSNWDCRPARISLGMLSAESFILGRSTSSVRGDNKQATEEP
jgi:hypothetical protein